MLRKSWARSVCLVGIVATAMGILGASGTHSRYPTVPLRLRYGAAGALPVARVAGTTVVRIPIYPRSRRARQHSLPLGLINPLPGSPYVRTATSAVYASRQAPAAVQGWIQSYFRERGWHTVSTGNTGSPSAVETLTALAIGPLAPLVFNLTVYGPPSGGTRYGFFVTDVVRPHRPASTRVPLDLVRMTGAITISGHVRHVVATNRDALRRLARALNRPSVVFIGFHCPLVTQTASIQVTSSSGRIIRVAIASGCSVAINGTAFQDYPAGPIWRALMHTVGG